MSGRCVDDGGPAFPNDGFDNGPGNFRGRPHPGMTLRTCIAMHALQGLLAMPSERWIELHKANRKVHPEWTIAQSAADAAFCYADAMIAQQDKPVS